MEEAPFRDLLQLSRLDFLSKYIRRSLGPAAPPSLAAEMVEAHRRSTRDQYQIAWAALQTWVAANDLTSFSKASLLAFLSYLAKTKSLSPRTVLVYRAALTLPLCYAFGIDTSDREFNLLSRSQFIANPPVKKLIPRWSLSRVLDLLESRDYCGPNTSRLNRLRKTLFLVALASGNRASELAAIERPCIAFSENKAKVTLPVRAGFLYKNQRPGHTPPNIQIRALMDGDRHHRLCPVINLRRWLLATRTENCQALFSNARTHRALLPSTLSKHICHLINVADPGRIPHGHDVRKVAASLAWTRGSPLSDIIEKGFWSSSHVFISRYLVPTDPRPGNCVAMGTTVTGPRN